MLEAVRAALADEPEGIRKRVRLIEGDGRDAGAHFLPGAFDVVLCHGVLMYVSEPDPLLAGLARVLAPGGLLSLLVRNADALAMRPGLAGDWDTALSAFDSPAYTNRIGLRVRADRREELTTTLTAIGAPLLVRRAGLHRPGPEHRAAPAVPRVGPAAGGRGAGRAYRSVSRGGGPAASVRGARLTGWRRPAATPPWVYSARRLIGP